MKFFRFLMVLAVVLLAGGQPSFAQKKADAKQKQTQVIKQKIESKQFTIDVNRMVPMTGRSRSLTSDYSLKLKGDSVVSYLPYSGEAYSIPYGGGKGLDFEAPIKDYSLTWGKKGVAVIKFNARTNEDNFSFRIQLFDNGSSSIQISPVNRQSITFYGNLDYEDN